jgi:hypothetical protein
MDVEGCMQAHKWGGRSAARHEVTAAMNNALAMLLLQV